MQNADIPEINPPINYPISYTVFGILIIISIILFILLVFFFTRNKKLPKPIKYIQPRPTIYQLKNKYLQLIDGAYHEFLDQKTTSLEAHQRLSLYLRCFIFEASGIPFQVMSLSEIINSQKNYTVSQIINEYYPSEFDIQKDDSDVFRSAELARKVIAEWN